MTDVTIQRAEIMKDGTSPMDGGWYEDADGDIFVYAEDGDPHTQCASACVCTASMGRCASCIA